MESPLVAWRACYEVGRAAHPEVAFPFDAFATYVDRLQIDAAAAAASGRCADIYLAGACLAGDARAIAVFDRDFIRPARGAIARVRAETDFIEETLQDLRRKLLVGPPPRLAVFHGAGPLGPWVRVAASRHALDLARATRTERPTDTDMVETIAAATSDPDVRLLREAYRDQFQTALRDTLASLAPRDRNLLRFHVLDGLSIDEIAAPYGVHRATAARWITAVHESILAGICDRLGAANPRLDAAQLASLGRAVRSELHISLWRLLGSEGRSV